MEDLRGEAPVVADGYGQVNRKQRFQPVAQEFAQETPMENGPSGFHEA
ncbi:MAG: hypothetical protein AB7U20_25020 [Planctomycetaceae bacterium]